MIAQQRGSNHSIEYPSSEAFSHQSLQSASLPSDKAGNASIRTTQLKTSSECEADSICFHPECQANRDQLTQVMSGCIEQPHINHQSLLFPIYMNSPGFRILSKVCDSTTFRNISKRKAEIIEEVQKLRKTTIDMIDEFTTKIKRKLECFEMLSEQRSIFKVSLKIKREGFHHYDCCLPIINKLKEMDDRSQAPSLIKQQIESIIGSQISKAKSMLTNFHKTVSSLICSKEEQIEQSFELKNGSFAGSFGCQQQNQDKTKEQKQIFSQTPIQKRANDVETFNGSISSCKQSCPASNEQILTKAKQQRLQPLIDSSQETHLQIIDEVRDRKQELQILSGIPQEIQIPFGVDIVDNNTIAIWREMRLSQAYALIQFLEQNRNYNCLLFQCSIFNKKYLFQFLINEIRNKLNINYLQFSSLPPVHLREILKTISNNGVQIEFSDRLNYIARFDFCNFFPKHQAGVIDRTFFKKREKTRQIFGFRNSFAYFQELQILDRDYSEIQLLDICGKVANYKKINEFMSKLKKLRIIGFRKSVTKLSVLNLASLFLQNKQLHTICASGAFVRFLRLVWDMKTLSPYQLKHIYLSAMGIEYKKFCIDNIFYLIGHHQNLETLVMINFCFNPEYYNRGQNITNFQKLKEIGRLSKLVYLNLYGCWPIFSDFVDYIHPDCRKTLKMLNLGCTDIDNRAANAISKFTNIESLNIDYTEIDSEGLLKITENMENLKNLSIQNLNGQKTNYFHRKKTKLLSCGKIVPQCLEAMSYKSLIYANIHKCDSLINYNWRSFPFLKVLRADFSTFSEQTLDSLKAKEIHFVSSVSQQPSVKKDLFAQQHSQNIPLSL